MADDYVNQATAPLQPQPQAVPGQGALGEALGVAIPALAAFLGSSKWGGTGGAISNALIGGMAGYAAEQPPRETAEDRFYTMRAKALEQQMQQKEQQQQADMQWANTLPEEDKKRYLANREEFWKSYIPKQNRDANISMLSDLYKLPRDKLQGMGDVELSVLAEDALKARIQNMNRPPSFSVIERQDVDPTTNKPVTNLYSYDNHTGKIVGPPLGQKPTDPLATAKLGQIEAQTKLAQTREADITATQPSRIAGQEALAGERTAQTGAATALASQREAQVQDITSKVARRDALTPLDMDKLKAQTATIDQKRARGEALLPYEIELKRTQAEALAQRTDAALAHLEVENAAIRQKMARQQVLLPDEIAKIRTENELRQARTTLTKERADTLPAESAAKIDKLTRASLPSSTAAVKTLERWQQEYDIAHAGDPSLTMEQFVDRIAPGKGSDLLSAYRTAALAAPKPKAAAPPTEPTLNEKQQAVIDSAVGSVMEGLAPSSVTGGKGDVKRAKAFSDSVTDFQNRLSRGETITSDDMLKVWTPMVGEAAAHKVIDAFAKVANAYAVP